jgi:hypothetical protein
MVILACALVLVINGQFDVRPSADTRETQPLWVVWSAPMCGVIAVVLRPPWRVRGGGVGRGQLCNPTCTLGRGPHCGHCGGHPRRRVRGQRGDRRTLLPAMLQSRLETLPGIAAAVTWSTVLRPVWHAAIQSVGRLEVGLARPLPTTPRWVSFWGCCGSAAGGARHAQCGAGAFRPCELMTPSPMRRSQSDYRYPDGRRRYKRSGRGARRQPRVHPPEAVIELSDLDHGSSAGPPRRRASSLSTTTLASGHLLSTDIRSLCVQ